MWRDPDVNEGPAMILIFAIIAAWMFIRGGFKKGKVCGIGATAFILVAAVAIYAVPEIRIIATLAFLPFLLVGGILAIKDNLF